MDLVNRVGHRRAVHPALTGGGAGEAGLGQHATGGGIVGVMLGAQPVQVGGSERVRDGLSDGVCAVPAPPSSFPQDVVQGGLAGATVPKLDQPDQVVIGGDAKAPPFAGSLPGLLLYLLG